MRTRYISISILISAITLFGCSIRSENCKELEKRLNEVIFENEELKKKINRYSFRPISIAKSDNIKLGEKYIANIRLAIYDSISPPKVVFFDSANYIDKKYYDNFYQCYILEMEPKTKGNYEIPGKIYFDFLGRKLESEFSIYYTVN